MDIVSRFVAKMSLWFETGIHNSFMYNMWQSRVEIEHYSVVHLIVLPRLKRCNTVFPLWVGLKLAVYTYEYLTHLHSAY